MMQHPTDSSRHDLAQAAVRDHLDAVAHPLAFGSRGWVNVPVATAQGVTSVRVWNQISPQHAGHPCLHCRCADRLTVQGRHADGCTGAVCGAAPSFWVCGTGGWGLPVCTGHVAAQAALVAADPTHITPGVCVNC